MKEILRVRGSSPKAAHQRQRDARAAEEALQKEMEQRRARNKENKDKVKRMLEEIKADYVRQQEVAARERARSIASSKGRAKLA